MRYSVRDFLKTISDNLTVPEPIYEFGSFRVPGQEELADLRPIFLGKKYIGTDIRKGLGVDKILDLHKVNLPNNSVGTALVLDTLEHVENPHQAMKELYRILRPGGLIVISSVMKFPIHNYPYDYWRFTPEAFKALLKKFKNVVVLSTGEEIFPLGVIGLGYKRPGRPAKDLSQTLSQWKEKWRDEGPRLFILADLLIPHIFIRLYRKITSRDRLVA